MTRAAYWHCSWNYQGWSLHLAKESMGLKIRTEHNSATFENIPKIEHDPFTQIATGVCCIESAGVCCSCIQIQINLNGKFCFKINLPKQKLKLIYNSFYMGRSN